MRARGNITGMRPGRGCGWGGAGDFYTIWGLSF